MLILLHIDWHSLDNKEISEAPDFKETFPPHCMANELSLLDDSIKAIRNPEKYQVEFA